MGPLTFPGCARTKEWRHTKLGFRKKFANWIFSCTDELALMRRTLGNWQFSISGTGWPGKAKLGFLLQTRNQKTRKPEPELCRPKFPEGSLGSFTWAFWIPEADLNSPCPDLPAQTLAFQFCWSSIFRVWPLKTLRPAEAEDTLVSPKLSFSSFCFTDYLGI